MSFQELKSFFISTSKMQAIFLESKDSSVKDISFFFSREIDFIYILSGKALVNISGKKQLYFADDLILISKGSPYKIQTESQDFKAIRFSYFEKERSEHFEKQTGYLVDCDQLKTEVIKFSNFLLDIMKENETHHSQKMNDWFKKIHLRFLEYINNDYYCLLQVQGGLYNDLIYKSINIFLNNIEKKISMEEVSQMLGVSHSYFVRIFNKEISMTPKKIYEVIKHNYAAHLLNLTNESIIDISLKLGFSDQSHFTNSFKKVLSKTPRQIRIGKG